MYNYASPVHDKFTIRFLLPPITVNYPTHIASISHRCPILSPALTLHLRPQIDKGRWPPLIRYLVLLCFAMLEIKYMYCLVFILYHSSFDGQVVKIHICVTSCPLPHGGANPSIILHKACRQESIFAYGLNQLIPSHNY